jgi:hypothetical protein
VDYLPEHHPENEFEDILDEVLTLVETIGDEVVGGIDNQETGEEIHHFHCLHGDLSFLIAADQRNAFFNIIFPVDLVQNISDQLQNQSAATPEIEAFLSESDRFHPDRPDEFAIHLLRSMNPTEKQAMMFHLLDRLSSPATSFRTETIRGAVLRGFETKRKIFPYEEGFGASRLNRAVQSTISVGHRGVSFLQQSLVFSLPETPGKGPIRLRFALPGLEVEREEENGSGGKGSNPSETESVPLE